MQEKVPTIEIPQAQFAQHIIDLAREGDVDYNVADEVREKIDLRDVFNTSNHIHTNIDKDGVELGFETTSSVSERVARKTHHHPAEYENHDVTIHGTISMEWTDGALPLPVSVITQEEWPTDDTPHIDLEAHRYDL